MDNTMLLEPIMDELIELNEYIYKHPELGHQEFKASKAHTDMLRKHGFEVETGCLDMETAFRAVYDSDKPGLHLAVMGEYDALPEIGHGCGHNMIGTIAVGTGIVLKSLVDTYGGKVTVLGTPAEETDGGKVDMAEHGYFNGVDLAMIAHPSSDTVVRLKSLAMEAIEFDFRGKSAHAAACPEQGVNALDAVIGTFNGINALREHLTSTTRIHGIITEGGVAANIVPEHAVAQFYVRATEKAYLKEVVEKVKNCARGAALATGAILSIRNYEKSYDDYVNHEAYNEMITKHLRKNGFAVQDEPIGMGSVDAGNVSHVCPTIHPMFQMCEEPIPGHTKAFAEATVKPYAVDAMKRAILSLCDMSQELLDR